MGGGEGKGKGHYLRETKGVLGDKGVILRKKKKKGDG